MAKLTVSVDKDKLQVLFNKMSEVFYVKEANKDLATLDGFDMFLPVIEEGINIDFGEQNVKVVKLTTGDNWVSYSSAGDPDISLQVASVAKEINELFREKAGNAITMTNGFGEGGEVKYKGQGYANGSKKAVGGLFFRSEDQQTAIWMPNVEMFGSFKGASNDKPAYYNVKVTPKPGKNGETFAILEKTA